MTFETQTILQKVLTFTITFILSFKYEKIKTIIKVMSLIKLNNKKNFCGFDNFLKDILKSELSKG